MSTFTREELFVIEYAINSSIDDLKDYCEEEGTGEKVARLEDLQAKVQGILRQTGEQAIARATNAS